MVIFATFWELDSMTHSTVVQRRGIANPKTLETKS